MAAAAGRVTASCCWLLTMAATLLMLRAAHTCSCGLQQPASGANGVIQGTVCNIAYIDQLLVT